MSEISIFTIERRKDFAKSVAAFLDDITHTIVLTSTGLKIKMTEYLDYSIRYWPYRCGATGLQDYIDSINIDMTNITDDVDLLMLMELHINLLHWASEQDRLDDRTAFWMRSEHDSDVLKESKRLLVNAEYILEQCNMRIREVYDDNESFPQYRIGKRDVDIDATLEAVPELSEVLLGYLDIRNIDDKEYKEKTLNRIYGYMEPRRNDYKNKGCSSVSEEFFACMNRFGIRHKTKDQIKIHYKKRNSIYDKLFRMALYVLQTDTVYQYKDEVSQLRNNGLGGNNAEHIS